jgi:hypothetical protein
MNSIENFVIETHGLSKAYKNVALKSRGLKVENHSIILEIEYYAREYPHEGYCVAV